MKTVYDLSMKQNPSFQTVNSLTNRVFYPNNIVSGRMATEDQVQQLWNDSRTLEERIDFCCRPALLWEFRVQIYNTRYQLVSPYNDNVTSGIARQGKWFTMHLPIKGKKWWDYSTAGQLNNRIANFENLLRAPNDPRSPNYDLSGRVYVTEYPSLAASQGYSVTISAGNHIAYEESDGTIYVDVRLGIPVTGNRIYRRYQIELVDSTLTN